MSQREVISCIGSRKSRVVPNQGGWSLRYSQGDTFASECFFLTERPAYEAAKRWERDGIEPRSAETLPGIPFVTDEQLEAMRWDDAAERLVSRG